MRKLIEYILDTKDNINEDFSVNGTNIIMNNDGAKRDLHDISTDRKQIDTINYDLLYINNKRYKIQNDINQKHNDGKNANTLLKTKDERLLLTRWLVSILLGYEDYYDVIRNEIISKGILSEDQLDAFILFWHERGSYYGRKNFNDNIDEYLKKYNVMI